jgi:hypothetical protein
VNWQGRPGLEHWPGAPGTRSPGPVQIGIGVDSARADAWTEGAVDEIVDDGSTAAAGAIDGREEATDAVLGAAADPLHAAVANAAAKIEIASGRHKTGVRASKQLARIIRILRV